VTRAPGGKAEEETVPSPPPPAAVGRTTPLLLPFLKEEVDLLTNQLSITNKVFESLT